jgi:hypothetical protein
LSHLESAERVRLKRPHHLVTRNRRDGQSFIRVNAGVIDQYVKAVGNARELAGRRSNAV